MYVTTYDGTLHHSTLYYITVNHNTLHSITVHQNTFSKLKYTISNHTIKSFVKKIIFLNGILNFLEIPILGMKKILF